MSARTDFLQGASAGLIIAVASAPFGFLFGMVTVDQGLSVAEAVLMSATIYGGASQMVGIELFGTRIAPALIVLSIVAVNFRHVLYSAVLGRQLGHWTRWQRVLGFFFLTDPQFAECERRIDRTGSVTFIWYMGVGLTMYFGWILETWIGAVFGRVVGNTQPLALDFALPIYFCCLVVGFRRRPFWLPVVVASAISSIIAYRVIGSPWHVTVGAVGGMLVAALLAPAQSMPLEDVEAEQ